MSGGHFVAGVGKRREGMREIGKEEGNARRGT